MKKTFIICFVLLLGMGMFNSCSKDSEDDVSPCSTAWAVELSDEAEAFSLAAQAYASNPTQANCEAYKASGQVYLDALRPYGDCSALTSQQKADWQAAYDSAKESLDNMDC